MAKTGLNIFLKFWVLTPLIHDHSFFQRVAPERPAVGQSPPSKRSGKRQDNASLAIVYDSHEVVQRGKPPLEARVDTPR